MSQKGRQIKKLGFVTPWFGEKIGGGAEMALRGIVMHLNQAGHNVEVLTTCVQAFNSDWNVNYHRPGKSIECGVTVRRFPVRKRNVKAFDQVNYKLINSLSVSMKEEEIYLTEMINSPKLYHYMEEHKDEYMVFVFIPYLFGTTYYGISVCPEKSVLIPCLHDEGYAYLEHFKRKFSTVAGMVFNAKPEMELAEKIYNLENVKTETLGLGLKTDINYNAERFRKKYGIQSPFIVYAGRKDRGKNVDTLIRYFQEYKFRNDSELKLILIGGGEIEIPPAMHYEIIDLGFVEIQDKYDAFAAADVLCQPSKNESFSLVIMESWLCRTPVLVHGCCPVTHNFVVEANGGLYFDGYFEFEGAVNYLCSHSDKSVQMAENGREYVLNHFAWDVIINKYMEFFEALEGK